MMYMSFKITYDERVKEFGELASLGMSKTQRRNLVIREAIILGSFGIIIGTVVGIILSFCAIQYLNFLVSQTETAVISAGEKFVIDANVEFYIKIPYIAFLITILVTYIVTIISSLLPMRKINKISPIEAIKNTNDKNLKLKYNKVPSLITKIFNQEGELAYKNIRKEKSKYRTIILSISISIILFLVVSRFLEIILNDFSLYNEYGSNDYEISLSTDNLNKDTDTIINYLKERNLINSYLVITQPAKTFATTLKVPKSRLSNEAKFLINKNLFDGYVENNDYYGLYYTLYIASGTDYEELLKYCGIENLNVGECILIDTNNRTTKYFESMRITNYNVGDTLVIKDIDNNEREEIPEIINNVTTSLGIDNIKVENQNINDEKEVHFKITGISDEKYDKSLFNGNLNGLIIVISEENLAAMNIEDAYKTIYLRSDNPYEIDNVLEELNNKLKINNGENYIRGINLYQENIAILSKNLIIKSLIYMFLILIVCFSIVNIFNIISSNIILRKKEFAMLKAIGMSNKQINNMLILEGLFYSVNVIFYGIAISLIILYMIYFTIMKQEISAFKVPLSNIIISIVVAYAVIFISIHFSKKKINKQNIIDDIRNDNI